MEQTERCALPLLAAGQAQKELTHNEALALIDLALQPVVQEAGRNEPPAAPALGQCWAVGATPTGAWAGRPLAIAGWTAAGWRFFSCGEGAQAWSLADGCAVRREGNAWRAGALTGASLSIGGRQVVGAQQPSVPGPTGGTTVDAEARAAIAAVIARLRAHGLIG